MQIRGDDPRPEKPGKISSWKSKLACCDKKSLWGTDPENHIFVKGLQRLVRFPLPHPSKGFSGYLLLQQPTPERQNSQRMKQGN